MGKFSNPAGISLCLYQLKTNMIRYFKHQEIDKERWDACINQSFNARFYVLSWFLDIVSPGWDGLVEDDYVAVFPVPRKKKYGIPYLIQPAHMKFIDIYSSRHAMSKDNWLPKILSLMQRFPYINIFVSETIHHEVNSTDGKRMKGQELDLSAGFDKLKQNFSKNITKNLKQASENEFSFQDQVHVDDFLRLKQNNYAMQSTKNQLILLRKLLNYKDVQCTKEIVGIKNEHGVLINAVALLLHANRIYILTSATTKEARDKKARFYMNEKIIEKYANSILTLDFMGSNIDGIAYFNKGFGAKDYNYYQLETGMLQKLLKIVKN
jgi:hypothetical protein